MVGDMADHYDIIIVGTGAGGAHWPTRWPRWASGSCCSSAGISCPGNWTTGIRNRCSWTGSTSPRTAGSTETASRSSRRSTTSSAGPPSCTARPCTACARRTSTRSNTPAGSLQPGRCPTTTSSRGTPRPNSCTRCTATAARTRPRATRASRIHGLRFHTSPGSSRYTMTWPRAAITRSTCRAGSCWTRRGAR
jgi:hypothetical protein